MTRPSDYNDEAYVFTERPPAKSSTSVLQVSVCQQCGHKLDGRSAAEGSQSFGKDGKACQCNCHR